MDANLHPSAFSKYTVYMTSGANLHSGCIFEGVQLLSGGVLDLRPKGRKFEPHPRHCIVFLEQDTFILA